MFPKTLMLATLSVALLALAGLSLVLGPVTLDLGQAWKGEGTDAVIFWEIRLPRILLAAAVGAALGASGCALQAVFQNPLAEPYLLGVSAGASLGAIAANFLPFAMGTLGVLSTRSLGAWAGGLGAMAIVYLIAYTPGGPSPLTLLLSGVAVSALLGSSASFLLLRSGEAMYDLMFWLLGGFSGGTYDDLLTIIPFLGLATIVLVFYSREMDLISLGGESARSMGLKVGLTRVLVLAAATMATAAAVAAAGIIGFVGLIVPHLGRMLVGPSHRWLIPVSILGGALLMVAADIPARLLVAPGELPVGVVTAFVGCPFFLFLLKKNLGVSQSG